MAEKQTHFKIGKTHESPTHKDHKYGSTAERQFDTDLVDDEGNVVQKLGGTADPAPDSSEQSSSEKPDKK